MMAVQHVVSVILGLLTILGGTANCNIKPFYLGGRNSSIFSVGTPPQMIGLAVSTILNDTIVASKFACSKYKDYSLPFEELCVQVIGGVFDPDQSSTYDRIQGFSISDPLNDPLKGANGSLSQDTVTFYGNTSNVTIPSIQLGLIDQTTNGIVNLLGLGPGSSVIDAMSRMRLIPSRSYSVDWGRNTVILGGYDETVVQGDFYHYPLEKPSSPYSYLRVEVADIIIEYPGQSRPSVSLMKNSAPFNMSIDPEPIVAGITLPQDLLYAYMQETSAEVFPTAELTDVESFLIVNPDMATSIRHRKPFDGAMSVVLSSGLRVTIKNELLQSPDTTRNGTVIYSSLTASALRKPSFTGIFLASDVHIVVDYERGRFSLAKAIKSALGGDPPPPEDKRRLISIGCEPEQPVLTEKDTDRQKTPKKVIVGAVVGAILGIALLGLIGFLVYRKAVRNQQGDLVHVDTIGHPGVQEIGGIERQELEAKELLQATKCT